MSNSGYKKPELVEKAEEQVGSDLSSAFGFLGKAMNAFLGEDEPKPVVRAQSNIPVPVTQPGTQHCNTCGGKREVGRLGYEVPCPACQPNSCKTCKGSGKLGTPGFEIDCPMCQIQAGK